MLDRRTLVLGLGATALAGCNATTTTMSGGAPSPSVDVLSSIQPNAFTAMYGAIPNEPFPIPAANTTKIDEKFFRQKVNYPTSEEPGTIIVDTNSYFLYLVMPGGKAMRYGVGLGRAGFGWNGRATMRVKKKWPSWVPPQEMIERQPELEKYSLANGGQGPGLSNPLGARALYLFDDKGNDTFYRIHGTREEWSIGNAVSSGCVRMLNHDVIDLYNRAQLGVDVIVL